MTSPDLSAWVGKTTKGEDYISASPIVRLAATLDKDLPTIGNGHALPSLGHWLYFLPTELQSSLGPDGHPKRGGFLPPVHHLPRRMWAGGRFDFHTPLKVGMHVERTSTIKSVKEKTGKTGPLVFVTVEHRVAQPGGEALLVEEHDIVYREARPGETSPDYPKAPGETPAWSRRVVPDEVMLFRYSALTFNGHRIHYDHPYVVGVEDYPGLIVHGPLMATLLADLVESSTSTTLRKFAFRSMSPMFAGGTLSINATHPDADGHCLAWASTEGDRLVMRAEAWIK